MHSISSSRYHGSPYSAIRSNKIRDELAQQPLQFNERGEGRNEEVAEAIIDTLLDKRSGPVIRAKICERAFKQKYVRAFSALVHEQEELHGSGAAGIDDRVKEFLALQCIRITHMDGSMQMDRFLPMDRRDRDSTGRMFPNQMGLPAALIDLIQQYACRVDFSEQTLAIHADILLSDDIALKDDLIHAACAQGKISFLNKIREVSADRNCGDMNLPPSCLRVIATHSLKSDCAHIILLLIKTLATQSPDDGLTVQFLKNAFDHEYQDGINSAIEKQVERYGRCAVEIRSRVKRLLAQRGIRLTQDPKGCITLQGDCAVLDLPERRDSIDQALRGQLPKVLADLIGDYDDQLKFCEKNRNRFIDTFRSGDQIEKVYLITAASQQEKLHELNRVFDDMRKKGYELDLSHTDLSGLFLRDINLSGADLSFCNLQDADLSRANLRGARLYRCNLNGALMVRANLTKADLTQASLIGAKLEFVIFEGTTLTSAILILANLKHSNLTGAADLSKATLDYADLSFAKTNFVTFAFASRTGIIIEHEQTSFDHPGRQIFGR